MTNIETKRPKPKTVEFYAWRAIKQRCNNPTSVPYKMYGGRGIKFYEPWNKSFELFFAYVGPRPSNDHSIDRINNDGNYEPGNVAWRTRKEQCNNRRNNKIIYYNGEFMTLSQWCDRLNLPYNTINKRITDYKWTADRAFTTPKRSYGK